MYVVTVDFDLAEGRLQEFLPLMLGNARMSLEVEPGCQQFDVCQDERGVFLYEVYVDRTAFEAHLASAHFKAFDAAVAGMVRAKTVRLFEEVVQ